MVLPLLKPFCPGTFAERTATTTTTTMVNTTTSFIGLSNPDRRLCAARRGGGANASTRPTAAIEPTDRDKTSESTPSPIKAARAHGRLGTMP